jgi:hypothetical protein
LVLRRSSVDWRIALVALGAGVAMQPACSFSDDPTPSSAACIEVTTHADFPDQTYYQRKTWDPLARILMEEGSASAAFTNVDTLKWRYADHGRVLAYIGVEQPFQHDYAYDDHDNLSEFRLSYPDKPDVLTPSTAHTSSGYTSQNDYSPAGRLVGASVSDFGDSPTNPPYRLTFGEDDAGRCQRIERTYDSGSSTVETRSYDDAGRLKRAEVTVNGTLTSHVDRTYDDQGRLHTRDYTAVVRVGFDGIGTATTTHEYASDGAETITTHDPLTDIGNDEHIVVTRSAACRAIDLAIGKPEDLRCRQPLDSP